jgi:hypothetical protein
VDGDERPEAESREWLTTLIPRLLRESGIDADARVARLRRAGGTAGVLAEIARIRSDGVKRAYYEALLAAPGLTAAEADLALRQAGRDIKSDGDLRGVLDRASRQRARSGAQFDAEAVGAAVRHMTSDGDITAVLLKFALEGDRSMLLMAMREAARVTSDGDKARFMIRTAPRFLAGDDSALHQSYFRTAKTITSDGDLANVLLAAIPHTRPSCAVTGGVISTSHNITSDGDRANVLVALAHRRVLDTKDVRRKFLEAAKGITSDGDYRRVVEALP